MLLLSFLVLRTYNKQNEKQDILEITQIDSLISRKINESGQLVLEHTQREFNEQQIKFSSALEMVELRQKLENEKIKVKNLNSFLNLQYESKGYGETKVIKEIIRDTVIIQGQTIIKDNEKITFSDTSSFLTLNGVIKNNTLNYDYTYNDEVDIISSYHKKNWFSKPDLQLTLVTDNVDANYTLATYSIKPKTPKVALGVGFGAAIYLKDKKIGISPAINIGVYVPLKNFY